MQPAFLAPTRPAPELRGLNRHVPYRNSVKTMALREIQFAESSPVRRQEKSVRGLLARGGSWAIRRAPSWRRVGPRMVVVSARKARRNLLLDAAAITIGLGVGMIVVNIMSSLGV
jgi:hypothetical protein